MLTRSAGLVALALLAAGCGATTTVEAPRARAPGVWYEPLRAAPVAATPGAFFDDGCADYLTDEAMFLRCQWVSGPDMAQHVPLVGLDAPLADRMRCHPLRDTPPGYRACLGRPA